MEWVNPGPLVMHLPALHTGRFLALCNGLLAARQGAWLENQQLWTAS